VAEPPEPPDPGLRPVVGLDAAFLRTETTSTLWHVVGVIVLDDRDASAPFDAEMLRRVLAPRLAAVDVLRQRVVDGPVGVAGAQWQIGDVDLDVHVQGVRLPDGAGLAEVAALAGEIAGRPLPRDRPLWEFTVVDGLADGRKALVAKVHHSLVDGVAAVGVLGALFGAAPEVPPVRHRTPTTPPVAPDPRTHLGAVARTALDQPAVVARAVTRLARSGWRLLRAAPGRPPVPALPFTAPRICLSRSITRDRSAAFAEFDRAALDEVRAAFAVTFNDVALALTAGVLRTWLAEDVPDRPLVTAVPTSVRRGADARGGNEVSVLFGALPVHLADAGERLAFMAEQMPRAKALYEQVGPRTLPALALVAPWNVAAAVFRAYSDLGLADRLPPAVNLVCTSVPGPRLPLYCGEARMEAMFPLGPIFDGAALNATVITYTDRVCAGFLTCPDVAPPVQHLADAVTDEVAALVAAARSHDARR
jgi:WS/DGAT/MGAT family acyltransferase